MEIWSGSKKNSDVELGEEEDFVDEVIAVVSSTRILYLWLVSLLLLLFSKICHQNLCLFNHVLVKAGIQLQEDKRLERKQRKYWKIAEKKHSKKTPKSVKIQRKKNFSKIYYRGWRERITFSEKVWKVCKRTYVL